MNQAFDLSLTPRLALLGGVACAVVFLLILVLVVLALWRRRGRKQEAPPPDLRLDVTKLPVQAPSADSPWLEFYGLRVRLAVLVLAPAGRGSSVPDGRAFERALESLLPGLVEVIKSHRPVVRAWSYQLSTQGFTRAFFSQVPLPGDRGKGTPWCAVAGRFESDQQALLAGLVCVAEKPNSFGQVAIQNVGQWVDVLRVKYN
jgi:hypothetical protein